MPINSEHFNLKNGKRKAFTIIEALMTLTIFLIIIVSFYRVFASGSNLIAESKRRLLATGLASEKMEHIRGMNYGSIGVPSGSPSGELDPDESVESGGQIFHVKTYISYVDDSRDGTAGAGDSDPNDYKKVIIEVSWREEMESQKVVLMSNFSPFGTEADIGGGTLLVSVIDGVGNPLSGASVHVYNNQVSPVIDYNGLTTGTGTVLLAGVPLSNSTYQITVSRDGYETVQTLPPYPQTSYYPTNVHFTVTAGLPSNPYIEVGKLSNLEMHFRDPQMNPIQNVDFSMVGGKILGTNTNGTLVYNFNEASLTSNEGGIKPFEDMSPGGYKFTVNEPGYVFWKNDSGLGEEPNDVILPEGQSLFVQDIILLDETKDSFFIKIADGTTGSSIQDATVTVTAVDPLETFNEMSPSDVNGYVFFPFLPEDVMVNGASYDVEVTASGYQDESTTLTADQLVTGTINLTPQ